MFVKTPPINKALTVNAVKNFAYISASDQDNEIQLFIDAVSAAFERITSKVLINTEFTETFDTFKDPYFERITLRKAIVQSITEIRYRDIDGVWQVLSPSIYQLIKNYSWFGEIVLKAGQSWPNVSSEPNSVEVDFFAGFGSNQNLVPPDVRQALLHWCTTMFEARGNSDECASSEVPKSIRNLVNSHKIKRMMVP